MTVPFIKFEIPKAVEKSDRIIQRGEVDERAEIENAAVLFDAAIEGAEFDQENFDQLVSALYYGNPDHQNQRYFCQQDVAFRARLTEEITKRIADPTYTESQVHSALQFLQRLQKAVSALAQEQDRPEYHEEGDFQKDFIQKEVWRKRHHESVLGELIAASDLAREQGNVARAEFLMNLIEQYCPEVGEEIEANRQERAVRVSKALESCAAPLSIERLAILQETNLADFNYEQQQIFFTKLADALANSQNKLSAALKLLSPDTKVPSEICTPEEIEDVIVSLAIQPEANYFLGLGVQRKIERPLAQLPVELKRDYLKIWERERSFVSKGERVSALSGAEVESAFRAYGEENQRYFEWLEQLEFKNRYHDIALERLYDVFPPEYPITRAARREHELSIVGKGSRSYGFVYSLDGTDMKFFKRDLDAEQAVSAHEEKFGKIRESDLLTVAEDLQNDPKGRGLRRLVQFCSQMPADVLEQFEQIIDIKFPEIFKQQLFDAYAFEDHWPSYQEIYSEVPESQLRELTKLLEGLIESRSRIASERYFGYRSENIDDIEFFLSFIETDPRRMIQNKHFSLIYYMFARTKLPEALTEEFETRFDIRIPVHLKNLRTLDQLLTLDSQELQEIFGSPQDFEDWHAKTSWLKLELEKLNEKIRSTKIPVHFISAEEMLINEGITNLTPEQSGDYSRLMHPKFRIPLEREFNADLSGLPVTTQIQLLAKMKDASNLEMEDRARFSRRYGIDGLHIFSALEDDEVEVDKIIWLGNLLDDETKHILEDVLQKYADGIRIIDSAIEQLGNRQLDLLPQDTEVKLRQNLRKRWSTFLKRFARIDGEFLTEKDGLLLFNKEKLHEEIERIDIGTVTFTATFRTLRMKGVISGAESIELMLNASFESVPASALSSEDQERILEIFDMYWAQKKFGNEVKKGLIKSFSNPKTTFHILRHGGVIVGYARTDNREDAMVPHTYFGSFNVDDSYEGAKIGEFIYRELIKHGMQQSQRIEADCEPDSDVSKFYMREFVATGLDMSYGEPLLHIVLDKEQYGNLIGHTMSESQIKHYAGSDDYKSGDVIIRETVPGDKFSEFKDRKIMSRYFNDKKTGKTYALFEPDRARIQ